MRFALVVLAACDTYAHMSTLNAPGNIDLARPTTKLEAPSEPGSETIAIVPTPYVIAGIGRYHPSREGSGEAGFEVRVERTRRADREPMSIRNWGVIAGFAILQAGDQVRTIAPGAFYGELTYRFRWREWPLEFGFGPAYYIDDPGLGAQLSVRCVLVLFRSRYVANTGGEFLAGVEIPIPVFISRSR